MDRYSIFSKERFLDTKFKEMFPDAVTFPMVAEELLKLAPDEEARRQLERNNK